MCETSWARVQSPRGVMMSNLPKGTIASLSFALRPWVLHRRPPSTWPSKARASSPCILTMRVDCRMLPRALLGHRGCRLGLSPPRPLGGHHGPCWTIVDIVPPNPPPPIRGAGGGVGGGGRGAPCAISGIAGFHLHVCVASVSIELQLYRSHAVNACMYSQT